MSAKRRRNKKQGDLFADTDQLAKVGTSRVRWAATFRLIQSRFPPINVFERISPENDWEALAELEGLTNPRIREELGQISRVPPARRVYGNGATIVMAPFSHISRDHNSRFSDGSYGIYYAGHTFQTALKEVAFHCARFRASTNDPPMHCEYRCYKGKIDKVLHDLRTGGWAQYLQKDPKTYGESQALAKSLRDSSSNGIVYPSVRDEGGECIAAFWPDVVHIPVQERHIVLDWDGEKVKRWFDLGNGEQEWMEI